MLTIRKLPESTANVSVYASGVKPRCTLAAICKVNVVENSVFSTHPSHNSFISPRSPTPPLIALSDLTCIILPASDAMNKVFKPSHPNVRNMHFFFFFKTCRFKLAS